MLPSRRLALLLAVAGLVAACSDSASVTTTPPATERPVATTSTTTTTAPPPPATPPRTAPGVGIAGSPGLGDPYFPGLGNGGYDVEHYTIELTVDPVANEIAGTTTVAATAVETLSSFNLDLFGLDVSAVRVDGREAAFSRAAGELTVNPPGRLPAGESFTVAVDYAGTPTPRELPGFPLPLGWQGGEGTTYVISEPSGAQTWYPVNDHPTDKATYTFRITAPEEYAVAANGVLVDSIDEGDATTHVWAMDQPMASYLATVVVGDMYRDDSAGPGDLPLRNYFPADLANGPELFSQAAEMLEFLEERVAPYPFDAYGVVVAGSFPAALETQSLSIFGGLISTVSAESIESVAMHELAHQWYGDSVSPATWRDVWLNEGFATYFEVLWREHTRGAEEYAGIIADYHGIVSSQELPPPGDPGPDAMFGASTYLRGALTLHALRVEVGDEAFFEILRTYYRRHAYGVASTADFVAVAEEVAGRDLGGLFTAWLDEPIVPPLPEG